MLGKFVLRDFVHVLDVSRNGLLEEALIISGRIGRFQSGKFYNGFQYVYHLAIYLPISLS